MLKLKVTMKTTSTQVRTIQSTFIVFYNSASSFSSSPCTSCMYENVWSANNKPETEGEEQGRDRDGKTVVAK
jgi:hypothetical protein